jgi:hypothetical protein
MLGSFGLWASSKGMKSVSNLVGQTRANAKTQIVSDGFIVGTETAQNYTNAADADKNDKIVSQTPSAGTLAQYESSIDISYGVFNFTPFGVFGFTPTFGVFGFTPTFNVFSFTPFNVFSFTPFSVFGFAFSVFGFTPFSVFGFAFSVFGFTPTFAVFGFR